MRNSSSRLRRVGRAILYLGVVGLALALSFGSFSTSDVGAQDPSTLSTNHSIGVDKGVWNDGQAALWDLNLIDHFRVFGPEERLKGYAPEQPIKYSHVRHVQGNQMECQFCHWSVAKAPYAALPEVGVCSGCHKFVAGTDEAQKTEIKKILEYEAKGEQIPWIKVHVMPDHVKFNHKRHVKAGVACQSCHGQVQEMEVVQRVSSMKMGWCLDCHRTQGASIDCVTCHH